MRSENNISNRTEKKQKDRKAKVREICKFIAVRAIVTIAFQVLLKLFGF